MPSSKQNTFQPNQYDKIIRENLEQTLPVIIKDLLHLDIVVSEEIPDDIQHTRERKPDALKKVTDSQGSTYILHLEFQVPNEKEMVYRMAEYLANLGDSNPGEAIQSIVNEINTTTESHLSKDKYFKQLRIFVQLRTHVEHQLEEAMQSITTFFKEENDIFYRKGERKGIEKGIERGIEKGIERGIEKTRHAVIENLLTKLGVSDEKAAEIAEVSVEYVKDIRFGLQTR